LNKVTFTDLVNIPYKEAWDIQTRFHQSLIDLKLKRRIDESVSESVHKILFCEHLPAVYTLGKSGDMANLLLSESELIQKNIHFHKINRGGDITFHGPGQITGYPILDLDYIYTDIHKYVRAMEEAIIKTIAQYNIIGDRIEGYTGVWIRATDNNSQNRKICAIGVHLSRWVTMHGFALNVNTDLNYFDHIVPCGIKDEDKCVTSIAKEIGRNVDIDQVKSILLKELIDIYGLTLVKE
jgi:lipoyl(octanoyl) transferase